MMHARKKMNHTKQYILFIFNQDNEIQWNNLGIKDVHKARPYSVYKNASLFFFFCIKPFFFPSKS